MNKRGDAGDTITLEQVIFTVLNLVFVVVLTVFVLRASYGTFIYEQAYAKQLSLLIDEAKSGTNVSINMQDAIEMAKKYKLVDDKTSSEDALKKIVTINKETNLITVSLSGSGNGYSYKYFSGYNIKLIPSGVILKIEVSNE